MNKNIAQKKGLNFGSFKLIENPFKIHEIKNPTKYITEIEISHTANTRKSCHTKSSIPGLSKANQNI